MLCLEGLAFFIFFTTMTNKAGEFGLNESKGSHVISLQSLLMSACAVVTSQSFIVAFSHFTTSYLFDERWPSLSLVAIFCMPRPFFCCICIVASAGHEAI